MGRGVRSRWDHRDCFREEICVGAVGLVRGIAHDRLADLRSNAVDGFGQRVQLQTLHAEGGRHRKACAFVLLQFRGLFSNVLRRPAYPSLERGSYSALLHPHLAKRVGGH